MSGIPGEEGFQESGPSGFRKIFSAPLLRTERCEDGSLLVAVHTDSFPPSISSGNFDEPWRRSKREMRASE